MATDSPRKGEAHRSKRSIRLASRFGHAAHAPAGSNNNSNVNNIFGSGNTLTNKNSITNNVTYQSVLNESQDSIEVKISAGLKARHVPQAVYDAQLGTGCMSGTRVQILREIDNWIKNPKTQKIFWLTGWAGTGKSAIAWTVCSNASDDPDVILGGSFFCSRSASWAAQRDVRCVIPTLAQLLARQSNTFSKALADELARDPDVLHKHVNVQIEKLLSRPMLALVHSPMPVVFVIDALDECGSQFTTHGSVGDTETHRIVSEMLEALVSFSCDGPELPVKFLVTSRPETHIRDTPVSDDSLNRILRLHTVEKEQVTADIRLYVTAKLLNGSKLRAHFKETDAEMLAQLCDGLFIVATTALQYTLGAGIDRATTRFRTLLNTSQTGLSTGAAAPLDAMYALILQDASRGHDPETNELSAMLKLLATLLCARMILSVTAMGDLLGMPTDSVRAILSRLHAVVHVPENDEEPGLRTLHASFGDYLSRTAPDHIRISESSSHEIPARACFHVMAEHLRFNISQSRSSYEPNATLGSHRINLSLEYACTQWLYHFASLPEPSALDEMIDDVFRRQFLFWLEVMSILGQVQRASAMLFFAAAKVRSQALSRFLHDAHMFAASSYQAIERSAPHIYVSALPFASKDSLIYKTFAPLYTGLLDIEIFGINPHGGRLITICRGHDGGVTSVAYSPNGLLIASGSDDGTVRVWDQRTGEETMQPLRSDDGTVCSVTFAPNGRSVVSGTGSGAVCVWSLCSGHSVPQRFLGHSVAVKSVAVSSDSTIIVSASTDGTVRVWNAATRLSLAVLRAPSLNHAVTFSSEGEIIMSEYPDERIKKLRREDFHGKQLVMSPNGRTIVSIADQCITLWTQDRGAAWRAIRLDGHAGAVRFTAFSPNELYVASASDDGTVRIWDARRVHAAIQPPASVGGQRSLLAISLNGACIASIRSDMSVCVWNARTGGDIFPIRAKHISTAFAVAISSDGSLIALASQYSTIWILDTRTGETVVSLQDGHTEYVTAVAFSPDARWLASGSKDMFVLIWNITNGQASVFRRFFCDQVVYSVAFSLGGGLVAAISADWVPEIFTADWVQEIHIWQVDADQSIRKLSFVDTSLDDKIFFSLSPSGTHVATCGANGTVVHVWNIGTGSEAFKLEGHTGVVSSVAYSSDGRHICTGSSDQSTRLWSSETGAMLATVYGHPGPVELVGFTSDGDSIVSISNDATLSLWSVSRVLSTDPMSNDDGERLLATATFQNGWLTGQQGELLVWVPAEYRPHLSLSPCKFRVGKSNVAIALNSGLWHRGETWTLCSLGEELSVVGDAA